ncbi:hypothetical protein DMH01_16455 [Amycolatopsis sp. WAC 04182]|uniref:DUF6236 family protein n=1 Tax=Amycolatopsis sp. WAC 04182 TaxID=2203198 RepID=UPI000F7A2720|nr:DUF6236 family protein [Amycolatopsis sp. WAC 04182]RSN60852.1 hypothetical protein DMH01_16455 [Amycolatopsis sp. WAC 04182]
MEPVGLYYPYFHVRDDGWLKRAALYLPGLARVHPPGHSFHDSETAQVLRDELGFFTDIDPARYADEVAQKLKGVMQREEAQLFPRYGFPSEMLSERSRKGVRHLEPFGWLHRSQLGTSAPGIWWGTFRNFVVRSRDEVPIGTYTDENSVGDWIGLHPHLVSVYTRALVDRIAHANALVPVTDDPMLFALPGWTATDFEEALLGPSAPGPEPGCWWLPNKQTGRARPVQPATGPAAGLYATAAVQAVLPHAIDDIPAKDIVRARLRLSDEFEAFRVHLDELGSQFAALDQVTDPAVVQARIAAMADRNLRRPLKDLTRGLRSLRLKPIREVIGLRSLELPALAALGAHTMNLSPLFAAGGAVAVQLVASTRAARAAAADQRRSATGYLLGLRRELKL